MRFLLLLLATDFLPGCALLPRNAVPLQLVGTAVIPGTPDVRAPAGTISAAMTSDLVRSFAQESPAEFPIGPDGRVHYAHLALSGGGAFGAGLLNGWPQPLGGTIAMRFNPRGLVVRNSSSMRRRSIDWSRGPDLRVIT